MIDPRSTGRRVWDGMMLLFVIWNAVVVPYDAAFSPAPTAARVSVDTVIDAFFGCDILLNFVTGYVDKTGRLQTGLRQNARKYLRKWFVLDLCSTLPFDTIVASGSAAAGGDSKLGLLAFLKARPRAAARLRVRA